MLLTFDSFALAQDDVAQGQKAFESQCASCPTVKPCAGKVRWKKQWPTPLVAAVTATSGGVLFTGDLDNNFLVLDARNGNTLYKFNTGGTVGGGVVTYELGGKQYVATTSGVVSGFFGGSGTSAIIVFALH